MKDFLLCLLGRRIMMYGAPRSFTVVHSGRRHRLIAVLVDGLYLPMIQVRGRWCGWKYARIFRSSEMRRASNDFVRAESGRLTYGC